MAPVIYIADDDADDVWFVRTALAELDSQIVLRHFVNGRLLMQGLQRAEQLPSLVIMDLNMPVMDGKEALRAIRSFPRFNDLPVVILSTSNHASEKSICYANGASNYITKPFNYSRYLEIVKKLKQEWIDEVVHEHPASRR